MTFMFISYVLYRYLIYKIYIFLFSGGCRNAVENLNEQRTNVGFPVIAIDRQLCNEAGTQIHRKYKFETRDFTI